MPDPSLLPNLGRSPTTNPPFEFYPKQLPTDNYIQRGYLRLLTEVFEYSTSQVELSVRDALQHQLGAQLHFQFNPNQLTRAVSARTDTQLWINQSPTQLLQPGIGDMSFGWTMLFNRETEVREYHNAEGIRSSGRATEVLESNDTPLDDLAFHEKAGRLGVIADIMVLDRITGQRITRDAVNYAKARYDRLVASGAITEEEDEGSENDLEALADELGIDLIGANAHNSAFLVPNPIRAVFSENFMVDGYVNSVTVSYQKFSPEMIPTVAVVDTSMHAIYQGFARKNTTFTTFLELGQSEYAVSEDGVEVIVPEEGTLAKDLFDLGQKDPSWKMLSGFNHIGQNNDGAKTKLGKGSGDDEDKIEIDGSAEKTGAGSVEARFRGGFKFWQFGKLTGTPLGDRLVALERAGQWDELLSDLSIVSWVGMSLRARLKTDTVDKLNVLWGNLSDYVKTDHFFGGWSNTARQNLFAVGAEPNFQRGSGISTGSDTYGQSGPYYTKAFPITEIPGKPGVFGDIPYEKNFFYGPEHIEFRKRDGAGEDWLVMSDSNRWGLITSNSGSVGDDDSRFWLAKGFFGATLYDDPCPDTLTLTHTGGGDNIQYDVEYQMRLALRVRMEHKHGDLLDTGLMYIHPRSSTTGDMPNTIYTSQGAVTISGGLASSSGMGAGTGVGISNNYPWHTRTANLSFNSLGEEGVERFAPDKSAAWLIDGSTGEISTSEAME